MTPMQITAAILRTFAQAVIFGAMVAFIAYSLPFIVAHIHDTCHL